MTTPLQFQPIPYATVQRPQLARDRKAGLIAFGVVSILIGALALVLTTLTSLIVTMILTRAGQIPPMPFLVSPFAYSAAATLFIWAGIGSIRCRRWVRPIVIAVGWPTLIGGVMALSGWLMFLPDYRRLVGSTAAGTFNTFLAVMTTFMAFFGIVVPATFVWFYTTAAVRDTLAAYDPAPSWTDRCPLPVFVGGVNLLLGGLMTLALATVGSAPFFGRYLEGASAALLVVAAAVVMIAAAVLFYRVHFIGWLVALTVVVLGFVSAMLTIGQLGVHEFYRRGGAGDDLLEGLQRSPTMTGPTPLVFMGILFAICLAYLLWVRRYFTTPARDAALPGAYPSTS